MRFDVPQAACSWSHRQRSVLAAIGVPVLCLRQREAPAPSDSPASWSAGDRDGPLARALARALGVPVERLWDALAASGLTVPTAAELRSSATAKRQLWRQLRTRLGRHS